MHPVAPARKIERKTAPDHREIFYNYAEVRYGVNDFLLQFSLIRDAAPGTVVITGLTNFTCSPQAAKSLARVLSDMVAAYEKQFGTIPQEPTPTGPVN